MFHHLCQLTTLVVEMVMVYTYSLILKQYDLQKRLTF